jgi:hypothetical protein
MQRRGAAPLCLCSLQSLQKFCRREDGNAPHLLQRQQILVAADNDIGMATTAQAMTRSSSGSRLMAGMSSGQFDDFAQRRDEGHEAITL